jgi:hypothetical protein
VNGNSAEVAFEKTPGVGDRQGPANGWR